MKMKILIKLRVFSFLMIALVTAPLQGKTLEVLRWSELPELPPQQGQTIQLGLAGAFSGIHNDALIIAGGANFPRPVWETSKVWHDDIYVLVKSVEPDMQSGAHPNLEET